jgi:hypothetical protein
LRASRSIASIWLSRAVMFTRTVFSGGAALSLQQLHRIFGKPAVRRHQHHPLHNRLRHQHPVEWVFVKQR